MWFTRFKKSVSCRNRSLPDDLFFGGILQLLDSLVVLRFCWKRLLEDGDDFGQSGGRQETGDVQVESLVSQAADNSDGVQ